MSFKVLSRDTGTAARLGEMKLRHSTVMTPVFMPVGTQAAIKALETTEIGGLGYNLMLVNAYHLWQRPGLEIISRFNGVRRFMAWTGSVLSDSGGFQVFSLKGLRRISEEGVEFRSHLDGRRLFLSPEESARIQLTLDSDIVMAFDECAPFPCDDSCIAESMRRSARWTERSFRWFRRHRKGANKFFGIIQGGMNANYRAESADRIVGLDCDGYAVGGLSVGEPVELMMEVLQGTVDFLPAEAPRYLMGVGTPTDILKAVALGVDMFDCVYPTRMARHAVALTRRGKLRLKNSCFRNDDRPLDADCSCPTCAGYSRAYIHHLFRAKEITAAILTSRHNLALYADLMAGARKAVADGSFASYRSGWEEREAS